MYSRVKKQRPPRRPSRAAHQQLERTFREWGFPVLLVRMDHQIRCHCTYATASPQTNCASCLGTGNTYAIEKQTVVEDVASVPETLARIIRQHEVGPIAISARHFYLLPQARPKTQDLIILTSFNRFGDPVSAHMTVYQVHHVNPYLTGEGNMLAYRASCTEDIVNVPIKSAFLRGDTYWPRYR